MTDFVGTAIDFAKEKIDTVMDIWEGFDEDKKNAAEYYLQAANAGHAEAQYSLGYMYRYGEGVNRDLHKAREWYEKAAKQGHAKARQHLENMNQNGR